VSGAPPILRIAGQWFLGFLAAAALLACTLFFSVYQLTSEETGQRILRRNVATTTEIDAILPRLEADLHEAARTAEGETITLPGFPITIDIPLSDAITIEGPELRTLVLQQSAERLYEDGTSIWDDADAEGDQDIERVSTAGALHRGFGLIADLWHTIFLVLTIASGVIALLLAAVLLTVVRGNTRFAALGGVAIAAGLPGLAGAVAVRFAMRTAESDADGFEQALIDLGVDTVWIFIRSYLIVSTLGVGLLAVSLLLTWWQRRTATPGLAAGGDVPS